jgi:uncharacterized membrane protein
MSTEGFALEKKNFIIILAGCAIIALGFLLMAGGGSDDPNVFTRDIFSFRRITLAPIVALIGFGIVMFGIIKKPKKQDE